MKLSRLVLGGALGMWVLGGAGCGDIHQGALTDLEDCVNGLDDNGDGLIDCDDPQCTGHAYCNPYRELDCDNGVDDDGDGQIDCDDSDCQLTQVCNRDTELACKDGQDNDHDGLIDCQDPDCWGAPGPCFEQQCCDGIDNDGDGLTDCEDPDCAPCSCSATEEWNCTNGVDDDGDGLKDCEDDDCAGRAVCVIVEVCNNGEDDDGNGLADCADPACLTNPYCLELNCFDGEDNDGNGLVDCDDPQCANAPACQTNSHCQPTAPLHCGDTLEGNTVGRVNNFGAYSCLPGAFDGPEMYFEFTAPTEMYLTIELYDSALGGLKLFATSGEPSLGCNLANGCEAETGSGGGSYLYLWISAGTTMYLIVDSPAGQAGAFDLTMSCDLLYEYGHCADGVDNDADGLTDCWDWDCMYEPHCDRWIGAGLSCQTASECAPWEYCAFAAPGGVVQQEGFCTRDCNTPGALGGQCATDGFGDGRCVMTGGQYPVCVLECGTNIGTPPCPPGMICTDMNSGSTTNVPEGYCLPAP
ncbi:MAG: hypothetical protein ABI333_22550 [bacterium]